MGNEERNGDRKDEKELTQACTTHVQLTLIMVADLPLETRSLLEQWVLDKSSFLFLATNSNLQAETTTIAGRFYQQAS